MFLCLVAGDWTPNQAAVMKEPGEFSVREEDKMPVFSFVPFG